MSTLLTMRGGRLTLPADLRRELDVPLDQTFEADVQEGAIVLYPAQVLRDADAWAYTAEHRELLDQAHADSEAGRVRRLTEDELAALGDDQE